MDATDVRQTEERGRRRRTFSEEFKRDAIRLVSEEKYTFQAAAAALGVGEQSLRQWHAKLTPPPQPCSARLEKITTYVAILASHPCDDRAR